MLKEKAVSEDNEERRFRWQILATLADLEEKQGNEATATDLRHEARTTLDCIIENMPEDDVRASFVALPEVTQRRLA